MEQRMYTYKCTQCGKLHHPKHYVCTQCGGRSFDEILLEGEAEVVTYTKVYNLPEGYMRPYMGFCIAKFPNGLCVSGQLEAESMETGMKVIAHVGVIKEGIGRDYYGFIFRPIK